jgi:ribosome-associated toxin RatA of RatAB toxin-antitoxin module
MVHVEIDAHVPGRSAADVYETLSDFSAYASCAEAVRSIEMAEEDGRAVSTWEVNFHGGILIWKEHDVFLPEQHTIQFRQLEGDVDYFSGAWSATDEERGCRVAFWADFDLGLAELGDTLEPIADAALRENVRGILSGLLGEIEFS